MPEFSPQFQFRETITAVLNSGDATSGQIVGSTAIGVTLQFEDASGTIVNFFPWTSVRQLHKRF